MEKIWPFSKCSITQNSPFLSGIVTFPDFSKIEGHCLCLVIGPQLLLLLLVQSLLSCGPITDTDAGPHFWKSLEK